MKLKEIAAKIDAYLKRFEANKDINRPKGESKISPYYNANARTAGRYVRICYISFQGSSNLTKSEALEYLQWLEDGNVGKHHAAFTLAERVRRMNEKGDAGASSLERADS